MQCTVEVCRNGCPSACDSSGYPPPSHILKPKISFNQTPNRKNENNQRPNQRGNMRRNNPPQSNYNDHSHDLVLDDDVALTAAESNHQPAAILPSSELLQNHRRQDEDLNNKNINGNQLPTVNSVTVSKVALNGNDIKLNNEQMQLIITTPKSIYKLNEDALQHENSKLISELKFAGMDLNRLANTLLNTKQSTGNNLNSFNSRPTDQAILDQLPSLTSHIQRLQNDHLENIFQNERLRELALESGIKLNQLNELLPQAQPLIDHNDKTIKDSSTIDFDNLLNSVNNLISSSSTSAPFLQITTSTSTTTQSPPVTENKDLYLDEETASDDIPNMAVSIDELNDGNSNLKQIDNQEKHSLDSQVNVRVLNHQLQDNNQFKHEPLPKNQPSYIIENTPKQQQLQPIQLNKNQLNSVPIKAFQQNNKLGNNNNIGLGMPSPLNNKNHQFNQLSLNNNKQQQLSSINYQNGHLLHAPPNLIQPLINHQHHQPLHFQYLPAFNALPLNSLPINLDSLSSLNSMNAFNTLNGLPPINLLSNAPQSPIAKPPTKQTSKLANLFKQNSLTQYGYSLLQSFKKDKNQNDNNQASILSLFPTGTRALRVGRNARMQIPNKLNLIKLKRDNNRESSSKVRSRRSIKESGSHVNVRQEFQVVTPLDMQFNDGEEDQQLSQPELLQGRSNLHVNESADKSSLICIQFKSTLMFAFICALLLFIISILACIFMIKRYKQLDLK